MTIEAGQPVSGGVAPNTPAPTPSATPATPAEPVAGVAELNREQTTMIGWLRDDHAKGLMTDAQLDTALREVTGKGSEQLKGDTRTPEERQFDRDFPVAKSHEIAWPHTDETITPQYNALQTQVNTYFIDSGMTKETAGYILKEADAFGYRSEKWTPEEHVLFGRAEIAKLECLWGDQTAQKIQMARQMVQKLEATRPGLKALLNETGLGNHSGIILALANHCERVSKRSKP